MICSRWLSSAARIHTRRKSIQIEKCTGEEKEEKRKVGVGGKPFQILGEG